MRWLTHPIAYAVAALLLVGGGFVAGVVVEDRDVDVEVQVPTTTTTECESPPPGQLDVCALANYADATDDGD